MPKLTIYNKVHPCYTNRDIEPQIIIQGELLPEFGFHIGAVVKMEIEQKKITITPGIHGNK